MKHLFLVAAIVAILAGPALAGSLTISLATPALTASKSFTISDADAVKLVQYMQSAYPQTDPACIAAPAATPPVVCSASTPAQAAAQWATGIAAGTAANVISWLKSQAAATAVSSTAGITIQ